MTRPSNSYFVKSTEPSGILISAFDGNEKVKHTIKNNQIMVSFVAKPHFSMRSMVFLKIINLMVVDVGHLLDVYTVRSSYF